MLGVLALVFLVVPFVELYVLLQVSHVIGTLPTIAVVLAVSVAGAWLVKREGLEVWRRARTRLDAREVPGRELVDGVLVLFAGALLLTPGFVTDMLGIALLLPPSRAVVRGIVLRWLAQRAGAGVYRGRPW